VSDTGESTEEDYYQNHIMCDGCFETPNTHPISSLSSSRGAVESNSSIITWHFHKNKKKNPTQTIPHTYLIIKDSCGIYVDFFF